MGLPKEQGLWAARTWGRLRGTMPGAALQGAKCSGVALGDPRAGQRREGDVRRLKVGKTKPAAGREGWRPGPGAGRCGPRRGRSGGRRRGARVWGAAAGRVAAAGARGPCVRALPLQEEDGPGGKVGVTRATPGRLPGGTEEGKLDRAVATQAGGRAVWATPPSPRPPPHCRWPRGAPSLGGPGRGRARAGDPG